MLLKEGQGALEVELFLRADEGVRPAFVKVQRDVLTCNLQCLDDLLTLDAGRLLAGATLAVTNEPAPGSSGPTLIVGEVTG
jgi:hypothetical protein